MQEKELYIQKEQEEKVKDQSEKVLQVLQKTRCA